MLKLRALPELPDAFALLPALSNLALDAVAASHTSVSDAQCPNFLHRRHLDLLFRSASSEGESFFLCLGCLVVPLEPAEALLAFNTQTGAVVTAKRAF